MLRRIGVGLGYGCVSLLCWLGFASTASALQSTNYVIDESAIGTGNMLESSSANFKATDAIGDLAVGNAASSNYQVEGGSKTTPDPYLAFRVNTSSLGFGTLSPSTTATGTATFSVLNYTSHGYIVQLFGSPLTNDTHVIPSMAITGPSQTGIEQFGINLVANTSPASLGANPDNGQFGFGAVDSNYNTTNQYRFVSGETIVQSPKSSGITNYTISYIVNVASLTPGGSYTTGQTLIVTGTY